MFIDEKFHKLRVNCIETTEPSASMNLIPEGEWCKEEKRISLRFRDYEKDTHLQISMSRKEALALGKRLVQYGETILDNERVLAIDDATKKGVL